MLYLYQLDTNFNIYTLGLNYEIEIFGNKNYFLKNSLNINDQLKTENNLNLKEKNNLNLILFNNYDNKGKYVSIWLEKYRTSAKFYQINWFRAFEQKWFKNFFLNKKKIQFNKQSTLFGGYSHWWSWHADAWFIHEKKVKGYRYSFLGHRLVIKKGEVWHPREIRKIFGRVFFKFYYPWIIKWDFISSKSKLYFWGRVPNWRYTTVTRGHYFFKKEHWDTYFAKPLKPKKLAFRYIMHGRFGWKMEETVFKTFLRTHDVFIRREVLTQDKAKTLIKKQREIIINNNIAYILKHKVDLRYYTNKHHQWTESHRVKKFCKRISQPQEDWDAWVNSNYAILARYFNNHGHGVEHVGLHYMMEEFGNSNLNYEGIKAQVKKNQTLLIRKKINLTKIFRKFKYDDKLEFIFLKWNSPKIKKLQMKNIPRYLIYYKNYSQLEVKARDLQKLMIKRKLRIKETYRYIILPYENMWRKSKSAEIRMDKLMQGYWIKLNMFDFLFNKSKTITKNYIRTNNLNWETYYTTIVNIEDNINLNFIKKNYYGKHYNVSNRSGFFLKKKDIVSNIKIPKTINFLQKKIYVENLSNVYKTTEDYYINYIRYNLYRLKFVVSIRDTSSIWWNNIKSFSIRVLKYYKEQAINFLKVLLRIDLEYKMRIKKRIDYVIYYKKEIIMALCFFFYSVISAFLVTIIKSALPKNLIYGVKQKNNINNFVKNIKKINNILENKKWFDVESFKILYKWNISENKKWQTALELNKYDENVKKVSLENYEILYKKLKFEKILNTMWETNTKLITDVETTWDDYKTFMLVLPVQIFKWYKDAKFNHNRKIVWNDSYVEKDINQVEYYTEVPQYFRIISFIFRFFLSVLKLWNISLLIKKWRLLVEFDKDYSTDYNELAKSVDNEWSMEWYKERLDFSTTWLYKDLVEIEKKINNIKNIDIIKKKEKEVLADRAREWPNNKETLKYNKLRKSMTKDADGVIKDILKNSFENEKLDLIYEFQNRLKWRKTQREAKQNVDKNALTIKEKAYFRAEATVTEAAWIEQTLRWEYRILILKKKQELIKNETILLNKKLNQRSLSKLETANYNEREKIWRTEYEAKIRNDNYLNKIIDKELDWREKNLYEEIPEYNKDLEEQLLSLEQKNKKELNTVSEYERNSKIIYGNAGKTFILTRTFTTMGNRLNYIISLLVSIFTIWSEHLNRIKHNDYSLWGSMLVIKTDISKYIFKSYWEYILVWKDYKTFKNLGDRFITRLKYAILILTPVMIYTSILYIILILYSIIKYPINGKKKIKNFWMFKKFLIFFSKSVEIINILSILFINKKTGESLLYNVYKIIYKILGMMQRNIFFIKGAFILGYREKKIKGGLKNILKLFTLKYKAYLELRKKKENWKKKFNKKKNLIKDVKWKEQIFVIMAILKLRSKGRNFILKYIYKIYLYIKTKIVLKNRSIEDMSPGVYKLYHDLVEQFVYIRRFVAQFTWRERAILFINWLGFLLITPYQMIKNQRNYTLLQQYRKGKYLYKNNNRWDIWIHKFIINNRLSNYLTYKRDYSETMLELFVKYRFKMARKVQMHKKYAADMGTLERYKFWKEWAWVLTWDRAKFYEKIINKVKAIESDYANFQKSPQTKNWSFIKRWAYFYCVYRVRYYRSRKIYKDRLNSARNETFYKKRVDEWKVKRIYLYKGIINWITYKLFDKIVFKHTKFLKKQTIKFKNLKRFRLKLINNKNNKITLDNIPEEYHLNKFIRDVPPQLWALFIIMDMYYKWVEQYYRQKHESRLEKPVEWNERLAHTRELKWRLTTVSTGKIEVTNRTRLSRRHQLYYVTDVNIHLVKTPHDPIIRWFLFFEEFGNFDEDFSIGEKDNIVSELKIIKTPWLVNVVITGTESFLKEKEEVGKIKYVWGDISLVHLLTYEKHVDEYRYEIKEFIWKLKDETFIEKIFVTDSENQQEQYRKRYKIVINNIIKRSIKDQKNSFLGKILWWKRQLAAKTLDETLPEARFTTNRERDKTATEEMQRNYFYTLKKEFLDVAGEETILFNALDESKGFEQIYFNTIDLTRARYKVLSYWRSKGYSRKTKIELYSLTNLVDAEDAELDITCNKDELFYKYREEELIEEEIEEKTEEQMTSKIWKSIKRWWNLKYHGVEYCPPRMASELERFKHDPSFNKIKIDNNIKINNVLIVEDIVLRSLDAVLSELLIFLKLEVCDIIEEDMKNEIDKGVINYTNLAVLRSNLNTRESNITRSQEGLESAELYSLIPKENIPEVDQLVFLRNLRAEDFNEIVHDPQGHLDIDSNWRKMGLKLGHTKSYTLLRYLKVVGWENIRLERTFATVDNDLIDMYNKTGRVFTYSDKLRYDASLVEWNNPQGENYHENFYIEEWYNVVVERFEKLKDLRKKSNWNASTSLSEFGFVHNVRFEWMQWLGYEDKDNEDNLLHKNIIIYNEHKRLWNRKLSPIRVKLPVTLKLYSTEYQITKIGLFKAMNLRFFLLAYSTQNLLKASIRWTKWRKDMEAKYNTDIYSIMFWLMGAPESEYNMPDIQENHKDVLKEFIRYYKPFGNAWTSGQASHVWDHMRYFEAIWDEEDMDLSLLLDAKQREFLLDDPEFQRVAETYENVALRDHQPGNYVRLHVLPGQYLKRAYWIFKFSSYFFFIIFLNNLFYHPGEYFVNSWGPLFIPLHFAIICWYLHKYFKKEKDLKTGKELFLYRERAITFRTVEEEEEIKQELDKLEAYFNLFHRDSNVNFRRRNADDEAFEESTALASTITGYGSSYYNDDEEFEWSKEQEYASVFNVEYYARSMSIWNKKYKLANYSVASYCWAAMMGYILFWYSDLATWQFRNVPYIWMYYRAKTSTAVITMPGSKEVGWSTQTWERDSWERMSYGGNVFTKWYINKYKMYQNKPFVTIDFGNDHHLFRNFPCKVYVDNHLNHILRYSGDWAEGGWTVLQRTLTMKPAQVINASRRLLKFSRLYAYKAHDHKIKYWTINFNTEEKDIIFWSLDAKVFDIIARIYSYAKAEFKHALVRAVLGKDATLAVSEHPYKRWHEFKIKEVQEELGYNWEESQPLFVLYARQKIRHLLSADRTRYLEKKPLMEWGEQLLWNLESKNEYTKVVLLAKKEAFRTGKSLDLNVLLTITGTEKHYENFLYHFMRYKFRRLRAEHLSYGEEKELPNYIGLSPQYYKGLTKIQRFLIRSIESAHVDFNELKPFKGHTGRYSHMSYYWADTYKVFKICMEYHAIRVESWKKVRAVQKHNKDLENLTEQLRTVVYNIRKSERYIKILNEKVLYEEKILFKANRILSLWNEKKGIISFFKDIFKDLPIINYKQQIDIIEYWDIIIKVINIIINNLW